MKIKYFKQLGDLILAKNLIYTPQLHHVGIMTGNFEEMLEWYQNVLGMYKVHQSNNPAGDIGYTVKALWMTNDGANHRIALIGIDELKNEHKNSITPKLQHIAFEYNSLDELLNTYSRLKESNILPVVAVDQGVSIAFYYKDPDGNTIELTMDTFASWEKSKEYMMHSEKFAERPMGQSVDIEKLKEARDKGITVTEIHERAYNGEFNDTNATNPNVLL